MKKQENDPETIDIRIDLESMDRKVEDYFETKQTIRTLNADLKDVKAQMSEVQELDKLMKRVKELRAKIKANENVQTIEEKIKTMKERKALLLELMRIDMLDRGQTEIKRNGRIIKLISNIREIKDKNINKKAYKNREVFR